MDMQQILKTKILLLFICLGCFSCKQTTQAQNEKTYRNLSQEFKDYWFAGTAEISTYELSENRYGEIRNGKAALIYVTEEFVPQKQVKANQSNPNNKSVLKLNSVKKLSLIHI